MSAVNRAEVTVADCPGDRHISDKLIRNIGPPEARWLDDHTLVLGGVRYEVIRRCPAWDDHWDARWKGNNRGF